MDHGKTHIRWSGHPILVPWSVPLVLRCRIENIEMFLPIRSNLEDTSHVATAVTVIRSTPDCRKFIVVEDGEPFHAELVCSEDVNHVVAVEELFHDL